MNDSTGSIDVGAILPIAAFISIFVVAIVVAIVVSKKRAKKVQEFAASRGLHYSRKDTEGLGNKVGEIFTDESFYLDNIITVETGQRPIFLCDCASHLRARPRNRNSGTLCLILSDRFRSVDSSVEILPGSWLGEKLIPGQIDMGDTEFARIFIVRSEDAAFAKELISPKVQSGLLMHVKAANNPVRIGIGTNGAALITSYTEPDQWEKLAELARRIEPLF